MRRRFETGETVTGLVNEGDVAAVTIELQVPRRKTNPKHAAVTHEATLLVARGADSGDQLLNQLAYYRGREMIIQYRPVPQPALGAVPFYAVLMCGEAARAGASEADRCAEAFLRTAEPPAHDRWVLTPDMKAEYFPGGRGALDRLFERVRREVARLVRPQQERPDESPEALRELLRIGAQPEPVDPRPRVKVDASRSRVDPDGSWNIEATVRLPDRRTWTVEPVLIFAAETGAGARVEWSTLKALDGCRVEHGVLVIESGSRVARFQGLSNPATHPAPAKDTAVRVVLGKAFSRTGGSGR